MQILLSSLENRQLMAVSCQALQNLCENCSTHMVPHMDGLLQLSNSLPAQHLSTEGTEALLKGFFFASF